MNARGVEFRRVSDLAFTRDGVRPDAVTGRPAISQALSRQARRPVPRGRLINRRSRRSLSRITDRPANASSYPTAATSDSSITTCVSTLASLRMMSTAG
jgi:hypothetical protein